MKLKFYLRGIGVGFILTAIILIISDSFKTDETNNNNIAQTQEQSTGSILAVDKDLLLSENTTEAAENKETVQNENSSASESDSKGESGTEKQTLEPATEKPTEPETKPAQQNTQAETVTVKPTQAPTTAPAPKPTEVPTVDEIPSFAPGTKVTIRIKDVYYGRQAADILYYAGVIDDREAYIEYIRNTGYSNIIKEGIYEVTVGDTYENISKIITRTN